MHTVHGLLDEEPWHERPIKRAAAQRTAAIVTVSEALRRDLLGRIGVTDPAPQVILDGIDTHRFSPPGRTRWCSTARWGWDESQHW